MKLILDDTAYYAYTAAHELREDRQTVVFVHGTAMDHTVWALQSRFFAYHNYNILAIDLPGHNLSQGQLLASIEQMAQWLNNLINLTPASGFHLVGHSMGSLIALEAATTFNPQGSPPAFTDIGRIQLPYVGDPTTAASRPRHAQQGLLHDDAMESYIKNRWGTESGFLVSRDANEHDGKQSEKCRSG